MLNKKFFRCIPVDEERKFFEITLGFLGPSGVDGIRLSQLLRADELKIVQKMIKEALEEPNIVIAKGMPKDAKSN